MVGNHFRRKILKSNQPEEGSDILPQKHHCYGCNIYDDPNGLQDLELWKPMEGNWKKKNLIVTNSYWILMQFLLK